MKITKPTSLSQIDFYTKIKTIKYLGLKNCGENKILRYSACPQYNIIYYSYSIEPFNKRGNIWDTTSLKIISKSIRFILR